MLSLAAQMLRFRKGGFVATFVALAAGVAVLMTCALLVESGLRYHGTPQRYARTVAVVADRDLTVTHTTLGEKESTTLPLPERGSVPESLVPRIAGLPGVLTAVGERWIPVTAAAAPRSPAGSRRRCRRRTSVAPRRPAGTGRAGYSTSRAR